MITIFIFSGQEKETSSEISNSAGEIILDILDKEIPEGQTADTVPIVFEFTVRNCAHIFLFFLMGLTSYLFVASMFNYYRTGNTTIKEILLTFALALMISVLYGGLDELHQLFINGRSASIRDVGIDTIGITIALAISVSVNIIIAKIHKR